MFMRELDEMEILEFINMRYEIIPLLLCLFFTTIDEIVRCDGGWLSDPLTPMTGIIKEQYC